MKLIDKKGRILGKIHILDLLFILAVALVLVVSISKVLNQSVIDISGSQEKRNVEVRATITEERGFLDVVQLGDILGEDKEYFDVEILSVEAVPVELVNLDNDGNRVVSTDPARERVSLLFAGELVYENMAYKLGSQELAPGKTVFLESDLYKLRAQIVEIKVVD